MSRSIESPYRAMLRRLAAKGTPLPELRLPKGARRTRDQRRWKALSRAFRREHPVCQACGLAFASEVHHRVPLAEEPDRGFDWTNLVSVCRACHKRLHGQRGTNPFGPFPEPTGGA